MNMKNIITIITIAFLFSCKAQSAIVPIGSGEDFQKTPSYYIKDVNNEFDKFVGEWKFQNGNTSITLKLKKEELYQVSDDSNYMDLLVGEYQYIENGNEIINTLADFDNENLSGFSHTISGGVFVHFLPNSCIDNSESQEIKVELFIGDPSDDYIEGRLILRYINDNGVERLETCIYDYTTLASTEDAKIAIQDGYYVFEKQ